MSPALWDRPLNWTAAVLPAENAFCPPEFPDAVVVSFDFNDLNSDILGGKVRLTYAIIMRDGYGPVNGAITGDFFPPNAWYKLVFTGETSGHVEITTCWNEVAEVVFDPIGLKDADSNTSNALSLPAVIIPENPTLRRFDASAPGKGPYQPN